MAQLSKAGWKLCNDSEKLWTHVLSIQISYRSAYAKGKVTNSDARKGIRRNFNEVKAGFKWKIGKGNSISFWVDC